MSASVFHSDDLRAYFWKSLGATTLMIAIPLVVVWVCSEFLFFRLPTAAILVIALAAGLLCSAIATQIWDQRSRTGEISFSELMLWSWFRVQRAERRLERGLRESDSANKERQLQILYELTTALESKDPYTRGHSRRVERSSFLIAGQMGMELEDVHTLRMSAALHDVGKITIPNSILHKPGRLDEEERAMVQEHPITGSEMVAVIGNEEIVRTVRHHHERWDGDGYPDGIAGTDIPLFARVVAVADSYDAIRSTRSYRPGAGRDEAVSVIRNESGHQYDPDVVNAFLATLPSRSPVVAGFMSLTGPGALWRFLWQLVQRFGSAGLAPALGALGATMVIVSSTLFSPLVPAEAAPVAASSPTAKGKPIVSTVNEAGDGKEKSTAERRAERRKAAKKAEARRDRRKARAAAAGSGGSESSGTSGSGTQDGGGGSGTKDTGGGSGTADGGTTPGSGSSSGTADTANGSTGDPNAQGADCEGKSSKGSARHCG